MSDIPDDLKNKLEPFGKDLAAAAMELARKYKMTPHEMFGCMFIAGAYLLEHMLEQGAKDQKIDWTPTPPTSDDRAMALALAHFDLDDLANVMGCFGFKFIQRGVAEQAGKPWGRANVMVAKVDDTDLPDEIKQHFKKGPVFN